jgi:hypothetical protein
MRIAFLAACAALLTALPCARADDKSHRQAAEELLQTMGVEKQMEAAIDQSLTLQLQQQPALNAYKDVMRKFFAKHISYAALKDDLIQIYVEEFSEPELRQITTFYKTPAGKKMVEKGPALIGKSMKLGMERVKKNLDELRQMIAEAAKGKDKQ